MKWFSLASTSFRSALSFRRNCRAVRTTAVVTLFAPAHSRSIRSLLPQAKSPLKNLMMRQPPTDMLTAARFLRPASRDHSFCSHFNPQDAITASRKPSVCQPPTNYQGSTQIINRKLVVSEVEPSAIGNPIAQTKQSPPLPQKGEKKQKKRTKIKTANGS